MRILSPWLLAVVAVITTSCSGQMLTGIPDEWPQNWPALTPVPQGNCPNITGTYANRGWASYSNGYDDSLANSLFQLDQNVDSNAKVRITQKGNEELHVQVIVETSVTIDRTLSRLSGDYECDAEGLWLKPVTRTVVDGIGYAQSSISMGLRSAESGVLAAQTRNRHFGLAFWVIPLPGIQTIWYLWLPAE